MSRNIMSLMIRALACLFYAWMLDEMLHRSHLLWHNVDHDLMYTLKEMNRKGDTRWNVKLDRIFIELKAWNSQQKRHGKKSSWLEIFLKQGYRGSLSDRNKSMQSLSFLVGHKLDLTVCFESVRWSTSWNSHSINHLIKNPTVNMPLEKQSDWMISIFSVEHASLINDRSIVILDHPHIRRDHSTESNHLFIRLQSWNTWMRNIDIFFSSSILVRIRRDDWRHVFCIWFYRKFSCWTLFLGQQK